MKKDIKDLSFKGKDKDQTLAENLLMKHTLKSSIKDIEKELMQDEIDELKVKLSQVEFEKKQLEFELIEAKNLQKTI